MHSKINEAMKRIILSAILMAFASGLYANPAEKNDTLSTSVVTGTRVSMLRDQVPAPVSVVGSQAIVNSDENALLPVLMEQVPGLFVTSRGVTGYGVSGGSAGAISLRGFGAGAGRVLILIDGHPQFESIYGHPVADEYLAANAEKVEVSRGAASVLYGSNAMGGAINILTKQPVSDGNKLSLKLLGGSYGTYRGQVYDSYKSGRFSASATFNYDHTDGHRANSAFSSLGGMLGAAYQLSPVWKAKARLSFVDADSQNPGTVASPMLDGTARILRGMGGVSLENNCGKNSGTVDLYYNWGHHIINDGHIEGAPAQPFLFHGTDYTAGLTAYQTASFFDGNKLTAGVDLLFYGGNAYRNPETEIYADHKKLSEQAVYLLDTHTLGSVTLSAGLRMDRHEAYGIEWLPQFGLSWMPGSATTLKASVSKGFRMPNMRELYMYAVANEALLPEKAWSYDLTAGHHFLDGALNVEASVFNTVGSNIIEVNIVDGKRQNRNVGQFANTGAELSADWKLSGAMSLNANYSFLHMEKIYTGAPVHKAWIGADWKAGKFSLNGGAMYIGDLYLTTGETPRKQSYVDVKLRAAYRLTDGLSLFVRGANLLNRKFETMDGFPEPGITILGGISWDI